MYMSYQTNREAVRAFRFRFTDLSTFVKPPSSVLGRVGPTLYVAEALSLGRVEPAHLDIMDSFLCSNNNSVRGVCWLRSINPRAPVSLILISSRRVSTQEFSQFLKGKKVSGARYICCDVFANHTFTKLLRLLISRLRHSLPVYH